MAKTVCFGEIMLRLSPPGFERLLQSPQLQATFGGGEANVAVSLAQFGHDSHYVTRLPKNPIGDAAIKVLRAEGVNVEHVQRGGERVGIYFAETGAGQRASTVVYDRAHSSISEMAPGTMQWSRVLAGAQWLHCTGITPALGAAAAVCTREALEAGERRERSRQSRPEFSIEVVDGGRGAAGDAAARAGCRRRDCERRGSAIGARCRGRTRRCHRWRIRSQCLSRCRRARGRGICGQARRGHASGKHFGE
jgi:hypothetical protein